MSSSYVVPTSASAVAGIDDDPLAEQVRPGRGHRDLLAQPLRPPALDPPVELAQRAQRRRPADAVRDEAVLALEGPQALGGTGGEHPVGPGEVVAEFEQLPLQLADVVADEQLPRVVGQDAVAEAPVRAGERGVGLVPDACRPRSCRGAAGSAGRRARLSSSYTSCVGCVGVVQQADRGEHPADLGDGATPVSGPQRLHGRRDPRQEWGMVRRTLCLSRPARHVQQGVRPQDSANGRRPGGTAAVERRAVSRRSR